VLSIETGWRLSVKLAVLGFRNSGAAVAFPAKTITERQYAPRPKAAPSTIRVRTCILPPGPTDTLASTTCSVSLNSTAVVRIPATPSTMAMDYVCRSGLEHPLPD